MKYRDKVSYKILLPSLSFRAKLNAARNLCENGISHSTSIPFEITRSDFCLHSRSSMGEGNTPIVRLCNLEKKISWQGQLWGKCEYQNPTGSFKDRGSVMEIAEALRQKKKGVVCASTGNMAASLSAYACRRNLVCIVVVPKNTPRLKLMQALACGAKLVEVDGSYDACVLVAKTLAQKKNFLLCGDYKIRRIGQQSIGVELATSNVLFDAFLCPVGNGTVGCAISEGFATADQYPRFIGIQATGANPIYQAWKSKTNNIQSIEAQTIASAMNVGNPLDGLLTLELVKKTRGTLYSVTDGEINSAQKLLAQTEGIFVEKAAAATVAGLMKFPNKRTTVVLILTGSGMKEGGEYLWK